LEGIHSDCSLAGRFHCLAGWIWKDILVGVDPIIGNSHTYILPEGLRTYLADLGYYFSLPGKEYVDRCAGLWYYCRGIIFRW